MPNSRMMVSFLKRFECLASMVLVKGTSIDCAVFRLAMLLMDLTQSIQWKMSTLLMSTLLMLLNVLRQCEFSSNGSVFSHITVWVVDILVLNLLEFHLRVSVMWTSNQWTMPQRTVVINIKILRHRLLCNAVLCSTVSWVPLYAWQVGASYMHRQRLGLGFGGTKNHFATFSWHFSSQISELPFLDQNFHFSSQNSGWRTLPDTTMCSYRPLEAELV